MAGVSDNISSLKYFPKQVNDAQCRQTLSICVIPGLFGVCFKASLLRLSNTSSFRLPHSAGKCKQYSDNGNENKGSFSSIALY
ncbi:hypothetical protein RAS2_16540 [Phycisphaerae bacterium RAS2]|nr:hypothetical protein RAS2_16540 [Phycisphaerae bacterium RAS2]